MTRDMLHHGRICEWLEDNGIDPKVVPVETVPRIQNGQITLVTYAQRNGRFYVEGDAIVIKTITVPLKAEPPADLADWLDERVDSFRRPR
ncbi:hypothetical protein Val02_81900 [Virgisporangium aliadipatigenens]|uniref:Uncharacterized protein n=1 Tax=Virgisporangium aliadipatigenens TaxID=741659 RepID=A0A8J3YT01_9ACTN|nr:hypothetical protein [Virgisporangium aliadipatigenens]GIJ51304.1 hypothetical protein Val02_81900 [Virgisporangium aliadipatigenens]